MGTRRRPVNMEGATTHSRLRAAVSECLTRSGTGCFVAAVPYDSSGHQRVNGISVLCLSLSNGTDVHLSVLTDTLVARVVCWSMTVTCLNDSITRSTIISR